MKTKNSLEPIFNPKSVAIVGASTDEWKWGHICLKYLISAGFKGKIFPVNPKADKILSLSSFPSLESIEEPVDLAVVTVPSRFVLDVVKDCVKKGIKGIVILTAGFSETGEEGRKIEAEIVRTATEGGARLVGPNCMGVFNSLANLNATGISTLPPKGPIALISQSGGMGLQLFYLAVMKGMGFSFFASMGNEADIRLHEYIRYMRKNPDTRAIVLYIEGIKEGREFMKEVSETTKVKPVIAFKVGKSEAGRLAAASHTGAIVGEDAIYTAAFKKSGVIRVTESDKLFEVAEALANLPPMNNSNVAIISDGGGHAATASDAADMYGLKVPSFSEETQERLRNLLVPEAFVKNPVDIIDISLFEYNPSIIEKCARICLETEKTGGLAIVGPFGGYKIIFSDKLEKQEEETAQGICRLVEEYQKPIVVHSIYTRSETRALQVLREHGIPLHDSIETSVKCLAALAEYGDYLRKIS